MNNNYLENLDILFNSVLPLEEIAEILKSNNPCVLHFVDLKQSYKLNTYNNFEYKGLHITTNRWGGQPSYNHEFLVYSVPSLSGIHYLSEKNYGVTWVVRYVTH